MTDIKQTQDLIEQIDLGVDLLNTDVISKFQLPSSKPKHYLNLQIYFTLKASGL